MLNLCRLQRLFIMPAVFSPVLALVGPPHSLYASIPGWWALALRSVLGTLSFRLISETMRFSSGVFSSELLRSSSGFLSQGS